jgi:hypothetical protein
VTTRKKKKKKKKKKKVEEEEEEGFILLPFGLKVRSSSESEVCLVKYSIIY